MSHENLPRYIFETSWEVCNKVGGIHTVVGTKALTAMQKYDNYIVIGPDLQREGGNPEFTEDSTLFVSWRTAANKEGLRVRIGHWKVAGSPLTLLVDSKSFIARKDELLAQLWVDYGVDSLSGGWDYVEPVLFGYAAARVVESFSQFYTKANDKILAHFHEWMTCSGALYLRKHSPHIATLFTTHATVMGRCIAGNGLPLYERMDSYNADELANQFGVVAKHSLEKQAAHNCDAFTTVSELTAHECQAMLGQQVSTVTANGFENSFVFQGQDYIDKRAQARDTLISVAEAALGEDFQADPLIVAISGRYEFKNKGIDEFIDSLDSLQQIGTARPILAYIMVPCWNHGPRRDLQLKLADGTSQVEARNIANTTHYLGDQDGDPVIGRLRYRGLLDARGSVRVMFVPCYLNGDDGIFNKSYYELLVGADVTVFPSYYEPWGYTPLESIAFGVPTITTTLAGFGLWVNSHAQGEHHGVMVIPRTDSNSEELVAAISSTLATYAAMPKMEMELLRSQSMELSQIALWSNLFINYEKAYTMALDTAQERIEALRQDGGEVHEQVKFLSQQVAPACGPAWTRMIVERSIPQELHSLEVLTKNLWWSWNDSARWLFESIDPELWSQVDRNPIAMLDHLTLSDLKKLVADDDFLSKLNDVYAQFQAYMAAKDGAARPKIAYFSMEFGLHASLKIYSGGLGILAGDY
ncbi:MAG: DUF3417 domain-containing protein, partial [Mucinivorans sp.]